LNEPDGIKTSSIPILFIVVSGIFPESFMKLCSLKSVFNL
jgi:hypothetical protein